MSRRSLGAWLAALLSLGIIAALSSPVSAEADDRPRTNEEVADRYVVVMEHEPLITEFGADGVNSAAAKARSEELTDSHEAAAAVAGLSPAAIATNYTAALNGFAVQLTPSQVTRIKSADGVLMVLKDVLRQPQTDSSIEFLGLTGGGGAHRSGLTGEGVVVGIIDSGIWPEHPSFADDGSYSDLGIVLDESEYPACDFGNTAHNADDVAFTCNNKLIGARQVLPIYRTFIGADADEFDSARDDNGHGTHTASTAAGNAGVKAEIFDRKMGTISGVAPRARIIAYKGLGRLGGFGSDLAAAIDQAVFDEVDVINYSIGSGPGPIGPDDIAFLFAAAEGVHVATSASNDGPGPGTIGNPATRPWVTSVAASTQDRFREAELKLGEGGDRRGRGGRRGGGNRSEFSGASITPPLGPTPLVDAQFAGGDLCLPGTLDPSIVAGKAVLCRRGEVGRAAKSFAVEQAGGVGMVLYNNDDNDNLFTDSHRVPSIHLNNTDGLAVKAYIAASASPTASISKWENEDAKGAPSVTYFSSRGPNTEAPDIIKPDITAPGHQILAGFSPFVDPGGTAPGELFASISGTSMSSPHIAGIMALLDQAHPDWTPAMVKSAMMTTAHQDVRDDDRRSKADPFDMGSGHVDPGSPRKDGSAFNPGLVYNADFLDYLGFLCDADPAQFANPAATCGNLESLGIPTDAVDLNYPSIGVSALPGSITITRTVTSVAGGTKDRRYEAEIKAPAGYEVEVTPKKLRVAPGETATYQVTITNVSAPIGEWRFGSLTWKSGRYEVRSPIAVRGASLAAPGSVTGSGVDGSVTVPVRLGYSGTYNAAAHGLEPATVFSGTVAQDPDQTFDPSDQGNGAEVHEVTTSGDAVLMIRMPPDATEAEADLDIFVIGPNGEQVATSTSGGTDEEIQLDLPDDGTYQIWVHGWSAPGGDSPYDLYTWIVSATPGGNMAVNNQMPTTVSSGQTIDLDVSWTGATAGQWHLGAVSHSDGAGLLSLTLVDVDNRAVPAPA